MPEYMNKSRNLAYQLVNSNKTHIQNRIVQKVYKEISHMKDDATIHELIK